VTSEAYTASMERGAALPPKVPASSERPPGK